MRVGRNYRSHTPLILLILQKNSTQTNIMSISIPWRLSWISDFIGTKKQSIPRQSHQTVEWQMWWRGKKISEKSSGKGHHYFCKHLENLPKIIFTKSLVGLTWDSCIQVKCFTDYKLWLDNGEFMSFLILKITLNKCFP